MKSNINLFLLTALLAHLSFTWQSNIPSAEELITKLNWEYFYGGKLTGSQSGPVCLSLTFSTPESFFSELEKYIRVNKRIDVYELDLTKNSVCTHSKNFSSDLPMILFLRIDKTSELDYLSILLNRGSYDSLDISLLDGFNQYQKLVEILKEKTFKSLELHHHKVSTKICHPIIVELVKETTFLTQLQSLKCDRLSFQSYLKLLEVLSNISYQSPSLPISLKKLNLSIHEFTNEPINPMEIDSLEEVYLSFYNKMDYEYPIGQLINIFPKLKKLFINAERKLEPFEIVSQELESIEIYCNEFKNQSEFIEQLRKEKSKLLSINIFNRAKNLSYKWSKEEEKNKPISK